MAILTQHDRANVVLWPSYSHTPTFAIIPDTYAVIEHTVTVLDIVDDADDLECSDEEEEEEL